MADLVTTSGWRKSTRSGNGGECVEVKHVGDTVLVRDSKYLRDPANDPRAQPIIQIPAAVWPTFLRAVVSGSAHVDRGVPTVERHTDGAVTLRGADGVALTYTPGEWSAFLAGATDREFDCPVLV